MEYTAVWKQIFSLLSILLSVQCAVNAGTVPNADYNRKASERNVIEPAFVNAGRVPGLEIWRIENFKPVPWPQHQYGSFYTGDSYIVLNTKRQNTKLIWDIHFWLGSKTSQDESGAAAILTVTLDNQLGGDPVQHREVQSQESPLFLSYFKSSIKYLPGGVDTGFTHVDRKAIVKRMFQVKGVRYVKTKQVSVSVAAMNKGDCFILDAGDDIYIYVGAKSRASERFKATTVANQIRDQDHGGRSKIHILDEYNSDNDVQEFFSLLGNGKPTDIARENAGGDDQEFENKQENEVTLYQITDNQGKLTVRSVLQKPYTQKTLNTDDCFVLDTVNANTYVWVGKFCNEKEKAACMSKAQEIFKGKQVPAWAELERVVEGAEPVAFTQYFRTWQVKDELHPRFFRSIHI